MSLNPKKCDHIETAKKCRYFKKSSGIAESVYNQRFAKKSASTMESPRFGSKGSGCLIPVSALFSSFQWLSILGTTVQTLRSF